MRARRERILRLFELDPARYLTLVQIQFRDLRSIPETAPGMAAIASCDHGVRE